MSSYKFKNIVSNKNLYRAYVLANELTEDELLKLRAVEHEIRYRCVCGKSSPLNSVCIYCGKHKLTEYKVISPSNDYRILCEIVKQALSKLCLSIKQEEYLETLIDRIDNKVKNMEEADQEELQWQSTAPDAPLSMNSKDRKEITGEVKKIWWKASRFNSDGVWTMIVQDDKGFRVRGSVAKSLKDFEYLHKVEKDGVMPFSYKDRRMITIGDKVTFTAILQPAKDRENTKFVDFKQPRKADCLTKDNIECIQRAKEFEQNSKRKKQNEFA